VKFDNLVPRFVAAHQLDPAPRTIQPPGQQSNQRFVRCRIHGRRANPDSQLTTVSVRRENFIGGRARLQFY